MKGRLILILCLAALAVGTAGPAAAQAEPLFEADSYPALVDGSAKGSSVTIFMFGAAWECLSASYGGELTEAASAITLSPAYEECRWSYPVTNPQVWSVVKVAMNGCDFRLHSLERKATDEYKSLLDLQCPAGNQVVVDLNSGPWTICRLTVPAQSNKSHVWFENRTGEKGALDDVWVGFGAKGLQFTQDLSVFPVACPVKPGSYESLDMNIHAKFTATSEPGKQIGFRVAGE